MKLDLITARNRMRVVAAVAALALLGGAGSAWADVNVDGLNERTGADSDNFNTYTVDDLVDADIINSSSALNDVLLNVDSGNNDVLENTTVGDVEGGDVNVGGSFYTELNAGMVELDGMAMGDVDASFENNTTGANSVNRNTLDVERDTLVTVTNAGSASNLYDLTVDTGDNDTNRNTTVGDVSTGDVDMNIEAETMINEGASSIDLGDLGASSSVDASFENAITGADSDNRNTVIVDDVKDIDVTNSATVTNDLDLIVDTGDNDTNRNTTVGDVSTGDVSIDFSFTNILN
ncbi:MAG: hypothetical protein ACOYBJ_00380 [Patescibacteria group bacterium]|jgi:hypothetical protein